MTTLEQVVAALQKRGRYDDAFLYGFVYPLQLMVLYGISEEEAFKMDVDELSELVSLPPESGEWDNFWMGEYYYARPAG